MADKLKQMHRKKILLVGGILMVALVAGLCVQKPEGIKTTPLQPAEELKLSDLPEAFKDSTLIIVGDNASDIEMQAVNEIADYLENETGNKPLVKKYSEISDEDKRNNNLIIVGTPKTNPLLEEVYAMTNATRVTEEFPGEGKGVLEILRNPWDESGVIFLIEGSDEKGVGFGVLKILIEGEEFKEFNFSSLEVDILNEKWVKENINPRICEEIFLEALYKRDIQVFINQYPPSHVPLKVKKRLKELGVKVNWSDARVPIGAESAYYPAVVPREHLDDIVKEGLVGYISKW